MNKNVIATVLIIVAIGIYFTISRGMIDEAKSVKTINDQYIQALDNAVQLISMRDLVTKKYNAISADDRARLDKMIPSTVDNIRLIIDMNNLALRHGFNLSNLKATVPSKANTNPNRGQSQSNTQSLSTVPGNVNLSAQQTTVNDPVIDKVTVSFSVVTGYDTFMTFMRDIEADLRIMDLTRLAVSTADDGEYAFDVELQTYWLRQ